MKIVNKVYNVFINNKPKNEKYTPYAIKGAGNKSRYASSTLSI